MPDLREILTPEIERTVEALKRKKFEADPIAGAHFSRIVSLMSSAYKRHGYILERAIVESLKLCPRLVVWDDKQFRVSQVADHIVDASIGHPEGVFGTESPYTDEGHRVLQVDAVVFNKETGDFGAYEIKRGAGLHDSGKRRSILRDLLCTQVLLKSYAKVKGFEAKRTRSHIVFYYGKCSIPKPFSLTKAELNEHFQWDVVGPVESVNALFRERLFAILAAE